MKRDPQVKLCLAFRTTPISVAEFEPTQHQRPEVGKWVDRQFKRFWMKSLPTMFEGFCYGRTQAEVLYKKRKGRIDYDGLKYISPRDSSMWTKQGKPWFIRVKQSGGFSGTGDALQGRAIDLETARPGRPAKGFWWVHDPLYDPFYGRSVCMGAWLPWRLKTLPTGGGMDALAKWFYRHAYRGFKIRHPDQVYQDSPGVEPVDAQSMARQMMESLKVGADIALSNMRDANGQYAWDIESYGEINGSAGDMISYIQDFLDVQIQRGIEIPDGIITDAGGEGYAGRKIPEDAFYVLCEIDLNSIVETFNDEVVKPLAVLNFGEGADDYEIKTKPLIPIRQQAAQAAIGPAGNDAAQGGAGGKGGESPPTGPGGGAPVSDSGPGGTWPLSLSGCVWKLSNGETIRLSPEWVKEEGPRHGTRWRNINTGRVEYGETPPGGRVSKGKERRARIKDQARKEKARAYRQRLVSKAGDQVARAVKGTVGAAVSGATWVNNLVSRGVDVGNTVASMGAFFGMTVASQVAGKVWDKMRPEEQEAFRGMGKVALGVIHTAEAGFKKGRQLCVEIAKERGFSDAEAEKTGRIIAVVDQVLAWGVTMPVVHHIAEPLAEPLGVTVPGLGVHVPGNVTVAKIAAFSPIASLCYAAYSTVRNPAAVVRAARKLVKEHGKVAHTALSLEQWGQGELRDQVSDLLEGMNNHDGSDWYEALVMACFDDTHDLGRAVQMANRIVDEYPEMPPGRARKMAQYAPRTDWIPYTGKRGPRKGQRGWVNRRTGQVVWGDRPPEKKATIPVKKPIVKAADRAPDWKAMLDDLKDSSLTADDLADNKEHIEEVLASGKHVPDPATLAALKKGYGITDEQKRRETRPGDRGGGEGVQRETPETGRRLEEETRRPERPGTDTGGHPGGEPAGSRTAARVPAALPEVNKRIDRFEKFFRGRGQHQVADWLGKLREHIHAVGGEEALKGLGEELGSGSGGDESVQYEGAARTPIWDSFGSFTEKYLERNGIVPVIQGESTPRAERRVISSMSPKQGAVDQRPAELQYLAGDFTPADPKFKDKLEEAKHLPGLEKSEDINALVGKKVTHLTPEVMGKMDEVYGKGQWIIKAYGDEAAAGYGIFFPQRSAQLMQDARGTVWTSGQNLARYGFSHLRDDAGKIVGIKHQNGDEYKFGTEKYQHTIHGDARHWADQAASAAANEQGAELPGGGKDFMAQPAFKAVGVSDADRAAGRTIAPGEGRVHIVTRNGKAEIIPHSTWIKGENLPVVFESEDTRAMAKAAMDAINALPESERAGQIYAPDIIKAEDGYRVVEANPANETGSSGYLGDNPFVIDSYVSHLTGRDPAHVRFIRQLLTSRKHHEKET